MIKDGNLLSSGGAPPPPWWWAATQITAIAFHMPLTLLTADSRAVADPQSALTVGALVSALAGGVYLVLSVSRVAAWKALTWVSIGTLAFWHVSGASVGNLIPRWAQGTVFVVLVAAAAGRYAEHRYMKIGLLAGALTLSGTLGVIALWATITTPAPIVEVQQPVGDLHLTQRPDIYLVLLDGYGRSDTIRNLFGHDNSQFEEDLMDHGLKVFDAAKTNYTITHFSVPAMLNMSYMHPHSGPISNSDLSLLSTHIAGKNQLVRILKNNGYRYVHGEAISQYNRCGDVVDVCLEGPLLDFTTFRLLEETPFGQLFFSSRLDPSTSLNLMRIRQMRSWADIDFGLGPDPKFVFLHLALPHPPLYLDRMCRVRNDPDLGGSIMNQGDLDQDILQKRFDAWIDQLVCANTVTLDFLTQIPEDSVVIVTSDHGPDTEYQVFGNVSDLSEEALNERVPTLTAARLPKCPEYVPKDVALVNLFRYVLSCLADEPLDPLPDRTFVASFGGYVIEIKNDLQNAD